jgi:uncharacterized membrane protein YgcG
MRLFHRLPPLLLLAALAPAAQAVTVEQVPSPRPDGWVTDLTGTLPLQAVAELNRMGDQVQSETGAGMTVVVVASTDGAPAPDLTARLFDAWGLGEKGLLLFVSVNDGTAEIVLGDGLRDAARVRESAATIAREIAGEMGPRIRGGDAAGAVLQGTAACARRLLGANVATAAAPLQASPLQIAAVQAPPSPAPSAASSGDGMLRVGLLAGVLLAASAIVLLLRNPRCPRCHQAMTRLDEAVNDSRLARSETIEKLIHGEGHQVWVCSACGEMQEIRRRLPFQHSVRTLEPVRLEEATESW